MKVKIAFLVFMISCCSLNAKINNIVKHNYEEGDFKLVYNNTYAGIFYDQKDFKVVQIAANHLAKDIGNVTGIAPLVYTDLGEIKNHVVIVGIIGHNKFIDQLIKEGKIDTAGIAGRWDRFALQVIEKPYPNITAALVILGSDRRYWINAFRKFVYDWRNKN